jgi:hypothetical protein
VFYIKNHPMPYAKQLLSSFYILLSKIIICFMSFVYLSPIRTKFTMVLCDSPTSYVCHINHTKAADLSEEPGDLCSEL